MIAAFHRFNEATRSPRAVLVSMVMSFTCFILIVVVIYIQSEQTKHEAAKRVEQSNQELARTQKATCGLFDQLSHIDTIIATRPTSGTGDAIKQYLTGVGDQSRIAFDTQQCVAPRPTIP